MNKQFIKLVIPHHTNKNKSRDIYFDSFSELEKYINEKTGFKPYIELMNLKILFNDTYIGTLLNNKISLWDDDRYSTNISLSDEFQIIYSNSNLWDIDEHSIYPNPLSTFLSQYTIYQNQLDKRLIVTVFNFRRNLYYVDLLDENIIEIVEQINSFVWEKYENIMY